MSTSRLLQGNDFVLESGQFQTVTDGLEAAQHTKARLENFTGDWFLDLLSGTPYFQRIFNQPNDVREIERILRSRISHDEVQEITTFSMDFSNRVLTVTFEAVTIFGNTFTEQVTINK